MNMTLKMLFPNKTRTVELGDEVTDVIVIDFHSIERSTLEPSTWLVWGHGPDDFTQLFDSYDSLDEAEKDYPEAVTILDFDGNN